MRDRVESTNVNDCKRVENKVKGKIAFTLGLAAGYVLGTRAGKERYEQIKKGANAMWQSKPVVKCRTKVSGAVGERVSGVQNYVVGKGKQILHAATAPKPAPDKQ